MNNEEIALIRQAVSYTLECGYEFPIFPNVVEEREEMRALLAKLDSGRWILTPVPWGEE